MALLAAVVGQMLLGAAASSMYLESLCRGQICETPNHPMLDYDPDQKMLGRGTLIVDVPVDGFEDSGSILLNIVWYQISQICLKYFGVYMLYDVYTCCIMYICICTYVCIYMYM